MKKKTVILALFAFCVSGLAAQMDKGGMRDNMGMGHMRYDMNFMEMSEKCAQGHKESCEGVKKHVHSMKKMQKQMHKEMGAMPKMKKMRKPLKPAKPKRGFAVSMLGFSREEFVKSIEEINPAFAKKLKKMQKENPRKFRKVLMVQSINRFGIEKEGIEKMKKNVIDLIELNIKEYDIVEAYKKSDNDGEKAKFKQELMKILSQKFDIRDRDIESKLKFMSGEVDEFKQALNKRKENKDRIVENRADIILGESLSVMW